MRGADQLQPGHLERSEGVDPHEAKMTVADYILFKLHTLGSTTFHTIRGMESCPLVTSTFKHNLIEPIFWDTLQEATWAGQTMSRCHGFCAVLGPENLLPGIFEGLVLSSYGLIPLLYVIRKSLKMETKELCGLPLSVQEKGTKELHTLLRKFSAAYFALDDRRTAAARIDKAIDGSLELLQPVVLELPDEVALSYIAPHVYRKTVFNYEDQEIIKSCWATILSRLEQAQSSLFILGAECYPPLWHHTLLILGEQFQAHILASESLFGHLGSFHPKKFQGYFLLEHLDIDLDAAFDSVFVFGVPSDCTWLETVTTHHDLSSGVNQELFILNSSGVSFGDGREWMPPFCLKEFFCQAPLLEVGFWPEQTESLQKKMPPWYSLIASLKGTSSPLFVPRDDSLISSLLQLPPFAKIFIQPDTADDLWTAISIAAWAKADPYNVIFAAGTMTSLLRAFCRVPLHKAPQNLIFLFQDSENAIKEAASVLAATILRTEEEINSWLAVYPTAAGRPGIIWMTPE